MHRWEWSREVWTLGVRTLARSCSSWKGRRHGEPGTGGQGGGQGVVLIFFPFEGIATLRRGGGGSRSPSRRRWKAGGSPASEL